jgi:hypothetical protein
MEAYHSAMNAHNGAAKTHPKAMEVTLAPWAGRRPPWGLPIRPAPPPPPPPTGAIFIDFSSQTMLSQKISTIQAPLPRIFPRNL